MENGRQDKNGGHSPPGSSPHLQFGEVALGSRFSQYPEKQGRKDQKSENQPDDHGYFQLFHQQAHCQSPLQANPFFMRVIELATSKTLIPENT